MNEPNEKNDSRTDRERDEPRTSAELAGLVASLIIERKGEDVVVLSMEEVLPITDYFVVATGRNMRHVDTMLEHIRAELKKLGFLPLNRSGTDSKWWVLLDYGSVVVHLFQPDARKYYDLEVLWGDAASIPLADLGVVPDATPTTERPEWDVSEEE